MWSQRILTRRQFSELLTSMNASSYSSLSTVSSESSMDGSRLLTILAYCSIFLVGLCGNAWVAYVIAHVLRRRSRESPRCVQLYILALCLGDFIILTFSVFLIMDLMYNSWVIESVILCRLYLSSESLNKFYVPFVLVFLSYFCYAKICRPHQREPQNSNGFYKLVDSIHIGSTRWTILTISLCAVCAFVLCIPVYAYGDLHYLIFDAIINETDPAYQSDHQTSPRMLVMPKCAFSPPPSVFYAFLVYSFLGGFAIPASLFTYFYSAILFRSKRRQRESITRFGVSGGGGGVGALSGNNHGHKSQFWRVAKTASGLVSFYLLCWAPYWMVNLYHAFTPTDNQPEVMGDEDSEDTQSDLAVVFGYFIHMLPYISSTGYPILYTALNRQILNAYRASGKGRKRTYSYKSRESVTHASSGFGQDGASCSRLGANGRLSPYGSGSSNMIRVNSCTSMNAINGEIVTNLYTAQFVGTPSDISAL